MKPTRSVPVPLLVLAVSLALAACTATRAPQTAEAPGDARGAAVAEMRQQAAAAEERNYPDVFAAPATRALSLRPVSEVQAIEAELSALGTSRSAGASPSEAAEAARRAALLRQLAEAKRKEVEEAVASGDALQ